MIDIHNHALFGIDDGASSIIDSINLLKECEKVGIKEIILTPHYILGSKYNSNNKDKQKRLKYLKEQAKENNINIELYLGNEIYYDNDLLNLLERGEATSLNNSKYVLFELPMHQKVNSLRNIVFELKVKGYIPVLAHPERYSYINDDLNLLYELAKLGVLFQCNIGSFFGIYGKEAKKIVKLLYKNKLITFLATDSHKKESKSLKLIKNLDKVLKKKDIIKYTETNPKKIIKNEEITLENTTPFKKGLFSKWK